jgi:hypothetical protein
MTTALAEGTPVAIDEQAHAANAELLQEATSMRDVLQQFTLEEQATFESYLAGCSASVYAGAHAAPTNKQPNQTWADWLANDAPEGDLVAFAEEHITQVGALAEDPDVVQAITRRRRDYTEALHAGVEQEWFSPYAEHVAQDVAAIPILPGDDLRDYYLRNGAVARHISQPNTVVFRQELAEPSTALRKRSVLHHLYGRTLLHELSHPGFGKGFADWEREVGAEATAALMLEGSDPFRKYPRPEEVGSDNGLTGYIERMQLQFVALHGGRTHVDSRLFMRALTSEGAHSREAQQLDEAMDAAWGVRHARAHINGRVSHYEELYKTDRPWAQAQADAAIMVRQELKQDPTTVFNQKLLPHVGAAVMNAVRS